MLIKQAVKLFSLILVYWDALIDQLGFGCETTIARLSPIKDPQLIEVKCYQFWC